LYMLYDLAMLIPGMYNPPSPQKCIHLSNFSAPRPFGSAVLDLVVALSFHSGRLTADMRFGHMPSPKYSALPRTSHCLRPLYTILEIKQINYSLSINPFKSLRTSLPFLVLFLST